MELSDDDFVEFQIFPSTIKNTTSYGGIASSDNILQSIKCEFERFFLKHSAKRIFECFLLKCYIQSTHKWPHVRGRFCFCENLDDEWFFIYTLFQFSQTNHDLYIRVWDRDGQVLLIECADHLPDWCSPEISENRVFIHGGTIHLLQTDHERQLELSESLQNLSKNSSNSPNPQLTECIYDKISIYKSPQTDIVNVLCLLPLRVQKMLEIDPTMISDCINAYYENPSPTLLDSFQSSSDEFCRTNVQLTNSLLTRIAMNKYFPHKRSCLKRFFENEPSELSHISTQLIHGFEVLRNRCALYNLTTDASEDIASNELSKFIIKLKQKGYFQNPNEDSQDYKERLKIAQSFYHNRFDSNQLNDSSISSSPYSYQKQRLLNLRHIFQVIDVSEKNFHDSVLCRCHSSSEEVRRHSLFVRSLQCSYGNDGKTGNEGLSVLHEGDESKKNERQQTAAENESFSHSISSHIKRFIDKQSDVEGVEHNEFSDALPDTIFSEHTFLDSFNRMMDTILPHSESHIDKLSEQCFIQDEDENTTCMDSQEEQNNHEFRLSLNQMKEELRNLDFQSESMIYAENFDDQILQDASVALNLYNSYVNQQSQEGPATNIFAAAGLNVFDKKPPQTSSNET